MFWFDLMLPEIPSPLAIQEHAQRSVIGYTGPEHDVLLVDDYPENLALLRDMLALLGFTIYEASNGQEALEKALVLKPGLIIIDLVMSGMTGFDAIRQFRQSPGFQEVTIIATSASPSEQTKQASLAAGANAFLAKPVREEELLRLLEIHLNIEWIYEETKTSYSPLSQGENEPIIPPSQEDLMALYQWVIIGDITNITRYLHQLKNRDQRLIPFVTKLHQFVDTVQLEQIQNFIELCLKRLTDHT